MNYTLVIGNGFDLACQLPSRFADYLNFLHSDKNANLQQGIKDYYHFLKNGLGDNNEEVRKNAATLSDECKELNTWDLIFLAMGTADEERIGGLRWMDVEQAIHDVVFDKGIYNYFNPLTASISVKQAIGFDYIGEKGRDIKFILGCALLGKECLAYGAKDSRYYNYLLSELKGFERSFSCYLTSQLSADYFQKAYFLALHLLKVLKRGEKLFPEREQYSLMSYNYVNYSLIADNQAALDIFCNFETSNIHGSLGPDRSVLLGMTPTETEWKNLTDPNTGNLSSDGTHKYAFSKEYRRMDLLRTEGESIRFPDNPGNVLFYGSSLSRQDYHSIFRIFDHVIGSKEEVLQRTKTGRLVFAYSVHDETARDSIIQGQYLAVKRALITWAVERRQNWRDILDDLIDSRMVSFIEIKREKSWPKGILEPRQ